MSKRLCLLVTALALVPTLAVGALLALDVDLRAATEYHPTLPSQRISCDVVDDVIARLPRGDGDGVIDADEIGPGGWRHGSTGRWFVTRAFRLNDAGDGYRIRDGRAKVGDNAGVVNDYPASLDMPKGFWQGALTLEGPEPAITLGGTPGFRLPGDDEGSVRVPLEDAGDDGVYEGCARTPYVIDLGPLTADGGNLMQRDYLKLSAMVDSTGVVLYWEVTEISVFRDTGRQRMRLAARRRG